MEKVKGAIILNGPGRSGTTLVYQILANHEDLAWISGWMNKFYKWPILSFFNKFYRANWNNYKVAPKPAEAYGYWKGFYGLSNDDIDDEIISLKKISVRM